MSPRHTTLLRATDEQTLLNDICRIVCEQAGYRMAWVGYAEQDEAKSVRPVAWAGVEAGFLRTANVSWSEHNERGRAPTGTAIRTGTTCYIQDTTTDVPNDPLAREHIAARVSFVRLPAAQGTGVHGMRERAELVGGQLTIRSELGRGTEVDLVIPASTAYVNSASASEL